jgi:hypothetical protein
MSETWPRQMYEALHRHWPEYMIEAAGLGLFVTRRQSEVKTQKPHMDDSCS